MLDHLKSLLVDDWRDALKWSSVQLHGVAVFLAVVYEVMPALDPSIAAILPGRLGVQAVGVYALIGLVLRVTKWRAGG